MANQKEKNYFDMFVTSVEFNVSIAKRLNQFVKTYDSFDDKEVEAQAIHELEHAADIHYHEIYEQLNKSFITPIEREDILTLAQAIDDVSDSVEDVAYSLYFLNIQSIRPEISAFADLIQKSCELLLIAVTEFKKFKKSKVLGEKILEVNLVEEEGDRLYHRMLRELFVSPGEPIDVMRLREIYEKLEHCLDSCESVADILDGIVLKNT